MTVFDTSWIRLDDSEKIIFLENYVRCIDSGYKWANQTISYSYLTDQDQYSNYSLVESPNGVPYDLDFKSFSEIEKKSINAILKYLERLINVNFVEVEAGAGNIIFGSHAMSVGGYSGNPVDGISAQVVMVNSAFANKTIADVAGFDAMQKFYPIVTHELGHALGLKHSAFYVSPGSETSGPFLPINIDNQLLSVMSYNKIREVGLNYSPLDIAALVSKYGQSNKADGVNFLFDNNGLNYEQSFDGSNYSIVTPYFSDGYGIDQNGNKIYVFNNTHFNAYGTKGYDTIDLSKCVTLSNRGKILQSGVFVDCESRYISWNQSLGYDVNCATDNGNQSFSWTNVHINELLPNITIGPADNFTFLEVERIDLTNGNDNVINGDLFIVIDCGSGDDIVDGFVDNQSIIGGDGDDILIIEDYSDRYTLKTNSSSGIDLYIDTKMMHIDGVERIKFSDQVVVLNIDTSPPTVIDFSPTDGSSDAAITANIVLTFSEAIQRGTGTINLRSGSADGDIVESFAVATSSRLNLSGSMLTIDPLANLNNKTKYFVTIESGAIKDLAGNAYAGTTTYDFTTIGLPNRAPTATNKAVTLLEDSTKTFSVSDFGLSDPNTDDTLGAIKITALESKGALKLNGADVVLNQVISAEDISSGLLTYLPMTNANGAAHATFKYAVSDGLLTSSNSATMTVNVTPVNDAPTGSLQIIGTPLEGQKLSVKNTLTDPDGLGAITYTWQSSANGVDWTTVGTGSSLTLTQSHVGREIHVLASYRDKQGTLESVESLETAPVQNLNTAPTSANGTVNTVEDTLKVLGTADFAFSDQDPADTLQSIKITALETKGALKLNGVDVVLNQVVSTDDVDAGLLTYLPAANGSGAGYANFKFTVSDGILSSKTAYTMKINVSPVRDDLNLIGTVGNDTLKGDLIDAGSYDLLSGLAGNDNLNGLLGNDTLIGGEGKDNLTGGAGNDLFVFKAVSETGNTATTCDIITDFRRGQDKIDLSGIDANESTGGLDEAFSGTLIGAKTDFSAAGQLKIVSGVLYGNTDADPTAEFAIKLTGISALTTADFIL